MNQRFVVLLTMLAFLIGGLAINVAVSCWRAAGEWGRPGEADRSIALRVAEVRRWIDRSPGDRILQYAPSRVGSAAGVTRTVIEAETPLLPQRWHRMAVVESGWPLPALAGERWVAVPSANDRAARAGDAPVVMLVNALDARDAETSAFDSAERIIPLRPVWPGVATNSVLYAMMLWLGLVALPRGLRSMARIRRSQCGGCGRSTGPGSQWRCEVCGWMRGISNWRQIANDRNAHPS